MELPIAQTEKSPERLSAQPWLCALFAAVAILGCLIVGYEPVGGDPDRLYRPLKSELARSIREGKLPFWSDRFGLGVPPVAESQVAAFYPLNPILYRLLDVNTAYRFAMLLHYVASAGATYWYSRSLRLTPWGSALAAVAFTFCGFQAIHSSHEVFYHAVPYLPFALLLTEKYLASGRPGWLGALALALAAQLFLGHFQIQMWTAGLVLLTGLWRVLGDRRRWARLPMLIAAVIAGGALATVQLALTWEFARAVGQTQRSVADLSYYSFPPAHWVELALPRFFQGLVGGPEDPYWFGQQTTGYEAALYVGTVPLIFACAGYLTLRDGRMLNLWRWIVPASFALATMPRWWPQGYAALLQVPGLGYFRCPGRYTLLTSLGLALLGGLGFDRALGSRIFRAGLALAVVIAGCALAAGLQWSVQSGLRARPGTFGLPFGVLPALVSWSVGLGSIVAWRSGRVGGCVPFLVAAVELGILFHTSTTKWGWSVNLPGDSPVLRELQGDPALKRVGGVLENIPVRGQITTASPYLGITLPPPHPTLKQVIADRLEHPDDPVLKRWLRRFGVTHLVVDRPILAGDGETLVTRSDPALDRVVYRAADQPEKRSWRVLRLRVPFPGARVATQSRVVPDRNVMRDQLSRSDALDYVYYLPQDAPRGDGEPRANAARVLQWDGRSATIEHDGACDLVLARAYDPGWRASIAGGRDVAVHRADGGFQAIRVPGSGQTRVNVRYEPPSLQRGIAISIAAGAVVALLLGVELVRFIVSNVAKRRRDETA